MHKILIIDDDEGIVDALSLILKDEGYTVGTSLKGTEAIKKVKDYKPKVILLDMLLSGKDGRDICRQLKTDPQTMKTPILMISAHPSASQEAMKVGADAFLAKPFDTADLLKVVKKFAEK